MFISGDSDTVAGLEKELSNAKEELELMAKKERESQVSLPVKTSPRISIVSFKLVYVLNVPTLHV